MNDLKLAKKWLQLEIKSTYGLCVRLKGCFDKVGQKLLERSQWNRNLPTLRLTLNTKIAAMSVLLWPPSPVYAGNSQGGAE